MIFKNYLYRMCKHPLNIAVYVLLPGLIIALNILVLNFNLDGDYHIVDGFNLGATAIVVQIMVMFQLFGVSLVYDLLYSDLRSDLRWRLLAAPKTLGQYIRANVAASILANMVSGVVITIVGRVIFDAYIFNIAIILLVMLVASLLAMGLGIIIFLCCPKKSTAEGLVHAFVWPQFIPVMFNFTSSGPLHYLFQRWTPAALAIRAITFSSGIGDAAMPGVNEATATHDMQRSFLYLGILAAMAAVVWVIAISMSKFKKF